MSVPGGLQACTLATRDIEVAAGARRLVTGLSLQFRPGEFVAILGRNGSGKTLTLHTLAGLRRPQAGAVYLDGAAMESLSRRAVALRLGLLAQDVEESFVTTALEAVLVGRHPHLKLWQWETAEDELIARQALTAVDLEQFAERRTDTLSGGELRRVAVAALLVQEPAVFLLDEPSNHLDPAHLLGILGLFKELCAGGRTVIATLHDPTVAARFADRVVLLHGDGRWADGPACELLTAERLSELYLSPMLQLEKDGRRIFVNA
ncbi:MAG: ABC transporter ATP-binding protein [Gammaproteobacteria bacterium]|nr:ABC transporter ATP-binding protein [Gammaproteobacteria bacterium]MDE2262278.1 ABC transporter ATP-binding protein [Gammaproteobacteria bacterium]